MLTLKTALLPHQQVAVDKLIGIKVGALYMEMGTGKTRTALEMIQRRLAAHRIERVLWLCPCSVIPNLKADIAKHATDTDAIAVHGIESLSGSLRLAGELMEYVKAAPTMLVVDESNLVKNKDAIRTKRVTSIATACPYRLILNGTPISRNETDLFAQWYILDWRILGYRSFYSFARNHIEWDENVPGKIRRVLNVDYLVEKIAPYSFQVKKDECFTLPEKKYSELNCTLTWRQDEHYDAVVDAMIAQLDEQRPETVYRMFAAAQAVISGLWVEDNGVHMRTRPMFENPHDNPRIGVLLDEIEDVPNNEQVLIFAKYTHEILSIMQVLREQYGDTVCPFYGGLKRREREASLQRFRDGARFLVANKACAGYGLNLQFCHRVIYYSNDWDYATRIQSEDRVHRLGQDKPVDITDICAAGTLDVKIRDCLKRKASLSDEVKSELENANGTTKARDKFRAWLRGELGEGNGEAIS